MSDELVCIATEARYSDPWKQGRINISKIKGDCPVEFLLVLFECGNLLKTSKNFFSSMDLARGYASLFGFSYHSWEIIEKNLSKSN